jgi:protein-tyrosine sulfotransferase
MTKPPRFFHERPLERILQSRVRDFGALVRRLFDLPASDSVAYDATRLADVDVARLQAIASAVRGEHYNPAIFVHGVMPRSGTNFIADLLQLHASISAYPHRLWEFPLLHNIGGISAAQTDFLSTYKRNAEVVEDFEFAAYLASGLLGYLQHLAGPGKSVLLKVPHAEYIYLFHALFPRDHCILVLRDGRDAIASHLKTFGTGPLKSGVSELADKWARSVHAALDYPTHRAHSTGQALIVRYENANNDPVATVREILRTCDLEEHAYDFRQIPALPVRGSSAIGDDDAVDWDPKEKPKDFQPVGRWHGWSRSRKRRFKRIAGAALVDAGYAADQKW